jgi:N,N'-diacetyllegionaminate synthase
MSNNIEIIAEVAQGYEGNPKLSDLLTTAAITSGAHSVKFQLVFADELATPDYVWYGLFKTLEMDEAVWQGLARRIHENNQLLYFDVFGFKSLEAAKRIGADGVKLSTTEFYNTDLMKEALQIFDKVIISVGGIPDSDIDEVVQDVLLQYREKICLIYGFQAEPTPLEQNNLLKLRTLSEKYTDFKLGFMDHSDGASSDAFNLALVALGLGINVIEKHITLDRSLEIEDYVSGLSPDSFIQFSNQIKRYEQALGQSSLELTGLEVEYRNKAVKLVVAARDIASGTTISKEDVALKRTGKEMAGEPIRSLREILGATVNADIAVNNPVYKEQL